MTIEKEHGVGGQLFEDFLREQGTCDDTTQQAIRRVLAFQLAQGLPADGRPGPMTFMQLNRAAGVDEPRLQTAP